VAGIVFVASYVSGSQAWRVISRAVTPLQVRAAGVVDLAVITAHTLVSKLPGDRPGERVFNQPWEIRAFAMAVAAYHNGQCEWSEFQLSLIESIRQWEQSGRDPTPRGSMTVPTSGGTGSPWTSGRGSTASRSAAPS
jgi:hypothetical protein